MKNTLMGLFVFLVLMERIEIVLVCLLLIADFNMDFDTMGFDLLKA